MTDINDLFGNAVAEGSVSQSTLNAINVPDLGAQIQAGLGIDVDHVNASEVTLVSIMPDDSGSIACIRKDPDDWRSPIVGPKLIRDGHNLVLDSLMGGKKEQRESILVHTRYLNGFVLSPFVPLDQAVRMTDQNYDPNLGTPLYDQAVPFLLTPLQKAQEFSDSGVPCRSVSLIISDGRDEHSRKQTAATVRKVVEDMLKTENHIIAFMGIGDGHTDFHQIALEMGILPNWILTPGNSESEIRHAFQVFSQSAVRASQGAGSFSKAAVGGFGA